MTPQVNSTPEQLAALRQLLDRVPPYVHCGIAGGAVVDFDKAQDIDIFFYRVPIVEDVAYYMSFFGAMIRPVSDEYPRRFVLGDAEPLLGKPVQVIVAQGPFSVPTLLGGFDISTHMAAVSREDQVIYHDAYTPPPEQPRVVRFNQPTITMRRLVKLCRRYGHHPHVEDIAKLLESIEREEDWGVPEEWLEAGERVATRRQVDIQHAQWADRVYNTGLPNPRVWAMAPDAVVARTEGPHEIDTWVLQPHSHHYQNTRTREVVTAEAFAERFGPVPEGTPVVRTMWHPYRPEPHQRALADAEYRTFRARAHPPGLVSEDEPPF